MPLSPLIQHLRAEPIGGLVASLQHAIGSDGEHGPCVYFAASYEKLRLIAATEEILPRNAVPNLSIQTEISATGVQARRADVFLGDGAQRFQPKKTHDCLNFFFNPYNSTLFAFARNQLIIGGLPLGLGILEIPLERISALLQKRGGKWACSDRNIAKGGYTSGLLSEVTGKWPWNDIFNHSGRQGDEAKAAEFLLWLEKGVGSCSSGLPVEAVARVLVPEGSPLDAFENCPHVGFLKNPDSRALLNPEHHLLKFDQNALFGLLPTLADFQTAASQLPIQLGLDSFANPQLASSNIHGAPHVTRVMLWTHYLCQPGLLQSMGEETTGIENLAQDALLAAAIHDLRRESHSEGTEHGENAAAHYSELIATHCNQDPVRENRIKSAVAWHCRNDAECPDHDNPVFKILKDADALDRGRFSGPCDGTDFKGKGCKNSHCNEHKGCAHRTLRLSYDKIYTKNAACPFRRNLAMTAWNVANATRTAPWDFENPVEFLVRWLSLGRERVLLHPIDTEDDYDLWL